MNIADYGVSSYNKSIGLFSPEESQKMRGTMRQSQTMGILGGIPQTGAYVLDPGLLNQIYDAKAVTPTVLNSYVAKVESAYGVDSESKRAAINEKVENPADEKEERKYLTPQEEIAERLKAEENKASVASDTPDPDSVVIEKVPEGTDPFVS